MAYPPQRDVSAPRNPPRPVPSYSLGAGQTVFNGPPPGWVGSVPHGPIHPATFLGPPGSVKPLGPYPGYMSPADVQAEALKETQQYYQPAINEYNHQARLLHDRNMATLAAVQALYQAIGSGESGPYAGMAANEGQMRYMQALQEGNSSESDFAGQLSKLLGEMPGYQGHLADQLQQEQAGLYKDYRTEQQRTAQQNFQHQMAYWSGQRSTAAAMSRGTHLLYVATPDGKIVPVTDAKGNPIDTSGMTAYQKQSLQARAQTQAETTRHHQAIENKPPTPKQPTNTGPYYHDPITKQWELKPGYKAGPNGTVIKDPSVKAKPLKPPSTATIRAGWKIITDSYPHLQGNNSRLDAAGLQRIYKRYQKVLNKNGIKSPQDLLAAPPAVKKLLGIVGLSRNPQDVYMDLIHSGIPARRAWGMVRKYYPDFGPDYFPKKR